MEFLATFQPVMASIAVASLAVGYWTAMALEVDDDAAAITPQQRYLASVTGATLLCVGAILMPGGHSLPLLVGFAFLGALMAVLVVMTIVTSEPPASLVLPSLILAAILGDLKSDIGPALTAVACLVAFGVAHAVSLLLEKMRFPFISAHLIIIVMLPVFMLGLSVIMASHYLIITGIVLIARRRSAFFTTFKKSHVTSVSNDRTEYLGLIAITLVVLGALTVITPLFGGL